jgi:hypothetical protein
MIPDPPRRLLERARTENPSAFVVAYVALFVGFCNSLAILARAVFG